MKGAYSQNRSPTPKQDGHRDPRCYRCQNFGHFAAEYNAIKVSPKPRLEEVNLVEPLTNGEELDLVDAEISRKVIVEGEIAGLTCKDVVLDTDACRTVMNGKLIMSKRVVSLSRS